jgi:hypothetical protein
MGMIVVYDRLTPALQGVAAQVKNTRPLMAALGRELQNAWREHFTSRGGTFWGGIRNATQLSAWDETSATVTVGSPEGQKLAHKIDGGVVRAKPPRKYLAIPANREARMLGWPSHWSSRGDGQLEPVFGRGRKIVGLALVGIRDKGLRDRIGLTRGKTKRAKPGKNARGVWKGKMMYWLKESVTHRPDPNAMPPDYDVDTRIIARAQSWLANTLARGGR